MRFNIQFENSNDVLPFVSVHEGLTEWYIDRLNENNLNSFNFKSNPSFKDLIDEMYDSVMQHNKVMSCINFPEFEVNDRRELLNPWLLNYMHSEWVRSKSLPVNVDSVGPELRKFVPDGVDEITAINALSHFNQINQFDVINYTIHKCERGTSKLKIFRSGMNDYSDHQSYILFDNEFGNSIITNNQCSLYLGFNLEGRNRRDKFKYHDKDYEFTDENNYKFLSTRMVLDFSPQETIGYSKEYIRWCKKHNIEPTGSRVNLGNLIDLEDNVFDYKRIVYNNQIAMNNFTLKAM